MSPQSQALLDNEAYLRGLVADGDRVRYYVEHARITGRTEALLNAQVSSFSGTIGGVAAAANLKLQADFGADYPGIYLLSQAVAETHLNAVFDDVRNGGQGTFDLGRTVELGQQAWAEVGSAAGIANLDDQFPGNFMLGDLITSGTVASGAALIQSQYLLYGKSISDFIGVDGYSIQTSQVGGQIVTSVVDDVDGHMVAVEGDIQVIDPIAGTGADVFFDPTIDEAIQAEGIAVVGGSAVFGGLPVVGPAVRLGALGFHLHFASQLSRRDELAAFRRALDERHAFTHDIDPTAPGAGPVHFTGDDGTEYIFDFRSVEVGGVSHEAGIFQAIGVNGAQASEISLTLPDNDDASTLNVKTSVDQAGAAAIEFAVGAGDSAISVSLTQDTAGQFFFNIPTFADLGPLFAAGAADRGGLYSHVLSELVGDPREMLAPYADALAGLDIPGVDGQALGAFLHSETSSRVFGYDSSTGEFLIEKKDSAGNVSFLKVVDPSNGSGDGLSDEAVALLKAADGELLSVQTISQYEPDKPPVTGTAIGEAFGSALGQYIAGDNAFAQVAIGAVSSTFFGSIGGTIEELFEGDSFDEAASQGFANFGERLGARAANLAIGQISSFIVGELIGGDSFAADFGRATANYFVSSTISQAVGFEVAETVTSFSVGNFNFDPITTIASFFASQLASSIVTPATQEAALVSSALSGIAGAFGATFGTVGSIVPVIGTFVGVLVGQIVGTLLGNLVFGSPGTPHAFASVVLQPDGTLDVPGVGWSENGGSVQDAINIANGIVDGLNPIIELMGGDAGFTGSVGTNWYLEVGYRAGEGFQWNKPGTGYVSIAAFEDLFADIANEVVTNRLSGGDAFGRRVYHYGSWTNVEELMIELTVAADYRAYLENRAVIDALIEEAPDTAFSIGWLTTIAQAVNMGLTNPDALQNKMEGTAGNDVITGTAYNDEIIGGAGNDTLDGGVGNDLLRGGAGNDILRGGEGQDSVSYADFTSGVVIDLVGLAVTGAGGTDTLESIERAFGSQGNDTIYGSTGAEILSGLDGVDTIYGGAGDDTIEGGKGADILRGDDGFDLASYAGSEEGVQVTLQTNGSTPGTGIGGDAQNDSLLGFEGIVGSIHSDILVGNAEDNLLIGNGGNDFLEGGAGADELLGGDGADFAVYTGSNAGVTVNLETGEATGGHATGDTFDSIEYVIGSDHDDMITGDVLGNVIEGGLGADTLDGGEGMDAISYANSSAGIHIDLVNQTVRSLNVLQPSDATGDTIANFEHVIGTNFADEIIVGHDNAVILAGGGDDIITPFSGNVSIDGGAGYDTADFSRVDAGGDFQPLYAAGLFTGSQWQDVQIFQGSDIYAVWDQALQGAAIDENSFSSSTYQYDIKLHSIEMLRATEFDDRIAFNDIGQHVDAAGGNDQMIGQAGNDVFYGGSGDDAIDGGAGNDTLRGDTGNDVLHGNEGADALYGGEGNDTLQGDGQFYANPYGLFTPIDTIAQGSDYLDGGAGNDQLHGGGANDVYYFGRGYGADTIVDSMYVAGPPGGKLNLPTSVLVDAGNDTIVFADDILPTDIEATSLGTSLILKIEGTSDQITITGMGHAFTAIESLRFDALGLTVDLTGLGAAGAASVISTIGNDAELFTDAGTFTPHTPSVANVTEIAGLTDFNNDGTLDVAGVNGMQAFVAYGSGDAFSYAQVTSKGVGVPESGIFHAVGTGVGDESETADIDGDGVAEIVSWKNYGANSSLQHTQFSVTADVAAANASATISYSPLDWVEGETFHAGDVTGDNKEELLRVRWGAAASLTADVVGFSHQGYALAGNISARSISTSHLGLTSATPFTWQLGDINADGRDDLIVIAANATYVALAQPTAFGTLTQTSAGITYDASGVTKYATGDIDGDGFEDLVQVNQSTISVAFGNASGTLSTDPAFNVSTPTSVQDMFTSGASFEVHLADKNGDGRDDLYFAGTTGVAVFTNNFAQTVGSVGDDVFVGTAGSDVFAGLAGNDQLTGGAGRDGLRGDEGADTLDGGAGNDYLEGGAGNDTLVGGADHDRAIYHSGAQYYTITQSGGNWIITDINSADGNDGTDTLTGVEEAYFDGRIVKLDGTNNEPFATGSAQSHVIDPGTGFSYTLPAGLFHDVDASDTLTYSLVMADGRSLPAWLSFDAATRTLSGTPGASDPDVLDLLAVASDGAAQATVPFRVAVRGTVSGTSGDDTLEGLGIYERMLAGDGNDTLLGSAGADILDGGAGVDTIDYSDSFFAINASLAGAVGTAGDAWGDQLSNIENIIGTKHADVIYGSSADNYIETGAGEDWVDAGAGNDTIKVGSRSAYVIGGTGWDIVDYSDVPAASNGAGLFVNLSLPPGSTLSPSLEGVEELIGTDWADAFTGDGNANTFRGGTGNDIFAGWAGNDILEGGAGADTLDGGDGSDTASYEGSASRVIVNLTSGTGTDGDAVGDTFTSIENLTGSAHNDLLYGDAGGNQLRGGDGHDHLWGYAGADYLDGGEGGDFARYDNSAAGVNVNLTADTATGGDATGDVLDNIEHLIGSNHNDVLTGDAIGNTLYGLGGIDGLYGEAGNDVLLGGTGGDTIHGGDGIDRAQYTQSAAGVTVNLFLTTAQTGGDAQGDILISIEDVYGSNYADTIYGDNAVNTLWGYGGNDSIHGNDGNDILYGQDGDDALSGGRGADAIDGGNGLDTVRFAGSDAAVSVNLTTGIGAGGFAEGDTYISIERADGTSHGDTLIGTSGTNILKGLVGNDTLEGGAGADVLDGGDGIDTVTYAGGTVGVSVNLTSGVALYGDAAGDSFTSIENLTGTSEKDWLYGSGSANTLRGEDGDDDLFGWGADDALYGGAGNDILFGGVGADVVDGGSGVDIASYQQASAGVTVSLATGTGTGGEAAGDTLTAIENLTGSAHNDVLTGDANANTIWGEAGDDHLYGGGGADTLSGGDGNDWLWGEAGIDVLNGGAGSDAVNYSTSSAGVTLNLATNVNTGGDAEGDTFVNIERLAGSEHADHLTGDASANILWGQGGHDVLAAGDGDDHLLGQSGDDTLEGGAGADILDGGDGFDTASYVNSGAGVAVDLQYTGTDYGDAEGDVLTSIEGLHGSAHNDWLYGDAGVNHLQGGAGDDTIYGRGGDDALQGGDGNDFIFGNEGADVIDGGAGNDSASYQTAAAAVTVNLATGLGTAGEAAGDILSNIQQLHGSAFGDTFTGSMNGDTLWGYGGDDILSSGAGNDSLVGGDGNDTISGGDGADALRGSAGDDSLDGGTGNDSVYYDWSVAGVTVDLAAGTGSGEGADTLISIENIYGSSHVDWLYGDAGANGIAGLANNDTIYGREGNDILSGGDGSDFIFGNEGSDHIDGGAGEDSASYQTASGGVAVDLTAGVGTLGEALGDTLLNIENLHGSGFDDVLAGDVGTNKLYGHAGNDTLIGGAGADTLDGGDGADTVTYESSSAAVTVDLAAGTGSGGDAEGDTLTGIEYLTGSNIGTDWLYGDSAVNILSGLDGNDVLYGRDGADEIYGGAGADLLIGGLGADYIDGGDGYDSASYQSATSAVAVNLATGTGSLGEANGEILVSIESLYGSAYDDTLIGDAGTNSLWGGAGADTLDGGAGVDTVSYVSSTARVIVNLFLTTAQSEGDAQGDILTNIENAVGSSYNDILSGDHSANVLSGGDGGDLLYGNGGDDTLDGGAGDDTLVGQGGADALNGGAGTDTANYYYSASGVTANLATGVNTGGSAAGDTFVSIENLHGSAHDDTLTGDADVNTLSGYDGNDTLVGGAGADTLDGGDGVDTASYAGSAASVTVDLAAGTGSGGDAEGDTLTGIENLSGSNIGTDWLYGDVGNNILNGLDGNDVLYGRAGADFLYGGAGRDLLIGDAGADHLDGGEGLDLVAYQDATGAVTINLAAGTGAGAEAEGDTLISIEDAHGSYFNDLLIGDGGANKLYGELGDDTLDGGLGADHLDGGDGVDTVTYANSTVGVSASMLTGIGLGGDAEGDTYSYIENFAGSAFDDTLEGSGGNNTLTGGAGDDHLLGQLGNDTLLGGAGNDLLYGGAGADALDGGDGVDTASYDASSDSVFIDLTANTATGGYATGDVLTNIENLFGSSHKDNFTGDINANILTGGGGNDWLQGHGGADTLDGGDGVDWGWYALSTAGIAINLTTGTASGGHAEGDTFTSLENLFGSEHDDALTGDAGANELRGNGGSDTLIGGAGSDTLRGGEGLDTLVGGAGADVLDGGNGWDTVDYTASGSAININLDAGTGLGGDAEGDSFVSIERVIGTAYNDSFTGDNGSNEFVGGDGHDDFRGLLGGVDTLIGGAGIDTAYYNFSTSAVTIDLVAGTGVGGNAQGDVLSSIERIVATDYNDIVTGDAADNTFWGLGGNDTLLGGAGNDLLYGGAGADTLDGGDGVDTASYDASSDSVFIDLTANTATGGYATGDVLTNIENLFGSSHKDNFTGDINANILTGGGGNDWLQGHGGADTLDGGDGVDWGWYALSTAGVAINLTTGTASGGHAEGDTFTSLENLFGSEFDDALTGDAGANELRGNGGSDTLEGGAGADTLDGGDGVDTASYAGSAAGVTIDLQLNTASGGDAEGDTLTNIENVIGSAFDDTLIGDGGVNVLDGGDGNDSLNGRVGDDTLLGGAGNDSLNGRQGADTLDGGAGIDTANYSASAAGVTIDLDAGTGSGGDAEGDALSNIENVLGSAHADTITGDGGVNVLSGFDGNDTLLGGGGDDTLNGMDGNDVLAGNGGADVLDGGSGLDTASYAGSGTGVTANLTTNVNSGGEATGDTFVSIENLRGSDHGDTLTGDAGSNTLEGRSGNDVLEGGAGADTLDGGGDHDVLYGQDGDDHLIGAGGHDTLEGGAGADALDGGDGIDVARYDSSQSGVTVNLVTGTGVGGDAEGDVLTGIEQIAGSAYDDVLTGDAGTNLLAGYGGNDTLIGGAGADHFDGGTGVDIVSYAGAGVGVSVNLMTGATVGGDSVGDTFVSIESIVGTDHNDVLTGDGVANTIWGGIGNDGLYGEAGDDILVGGAGADTLDGGAGVDTVSYSSSTAGVQVNIAAGVGNAGDAAGDTYTSIERVIGSAHNDTVWLGSGGQWAYGGAGDDVLVSSVGADLLDGETGQDEANYNTSNAAVSVNLATGIHTGGTAEGDTLVSIEDVFGSNFNDILTGDASANTLSGYGGDDTLEGGAGADTLDGGDGIDTASYAGSAGGVVLNLAAGVAYGGDAEGDVLTNIEHLSGSAHDDILIGSSGDNDIQGGAGNDQLTGHAGADVLDGGDGIDYVRYDASTSAVNVSLATGAASGGDATGDILINFENLVGSAYDDVLTGDAQQNILVGLAGNDTFNGGAGADHLEGGDGIDTASYEGSAIGVSVNLTSGVTQLGDAEGDALVSIENLIGSSHKDWLYGTEDDNTIQGGAGDDDLFAWGGSDVLLGGVGNDILFGGGGADTLDGGDGVDIASYQQASAGVAVNLSTGTGTAGEATGDVLSNIENLAGSAHADTLVGDAGANTIWGEAGDDVLQGGAGTNTLNGGLGTDTAIFGGNFADYSVSMSGMTGTVSGLGEASSLVDIEVLTFADRTITLDALNNAPILVTAVGNQTALRDVPFSLDVSGNFIDIDAGDTLSYAATLADGSALPAWISIDAATGVLSGTAATSDMGLLAIKVVATDGSGATAEGLFDLDVTRTNVAPVATLLADQAGTEGTALAFTIPGATFTDADAGDVLTLSATLSDGSALPAWLSFDAAAGTFSGTPTNTSAGVFALAVTATDSFGATAAAGFDLTIANANDAPTAANTTGSVDEGQVYTLDLATLTADLDGDALTYSLPTVPATGTTSLVGSVLTYTSVVGGFGAASIGYQVDDGNGGLANGTVDLTVNNINFAPTAGNSGATVNEGQGFTLDLSTLTNDLDGDALTYSISSGPAVGSASISGSTLTFNSTIGTSGNHNIGYTVSDGHGGTANGIVTATINDINFAPTANNSSGTVNEGQSFSINLATLTSDIDGNALTYSINSSPRCRICIYLRFDFDLHVSHWAAGQLHYRLHGL